MSELPFSHITEHKVYKRTFLHKVEVRFHYESDNPAFKEQLSNFLSAVFGVVTSPGRIEAMPVIPYRITNSENDTKIKFTDDFVEITFEHDGYISFMDSLRPILDVIGMFFKDIEADIDKLSISKMNGLSIHTSEVKTDKMVAIGKMFTKEALEHPFIEVGPNQPEEERRMLKFETETDGVKTELMFVMALEEIEGNDSNMSIKLTSFARCNDRINPGNLAGMAFALNSQLYDGFHWIINPVLIDYMGKEAKS